MEKEKEARFSDYLNILYKWKKLLLINMLIIVVGATVYSFLIPERFKATSLVMVTSENAGRIGALISGGGLASIGSQFLGMSSPSQDIILGIFKSRTALTRVIKKFNLLKYYDIDDNNMDKTLKEFIGDVIFEPTENGMIEVSVINEDPKLSAEMANYFVKLADSINIDLNIEQARNNRIFIETRYLKNINDLRVAEDSFYYFQKEYGIFSVPEQLKASVKAAAEIEALYMEKEVTAELIKRQYGENSPLYEVTMDELHFLKKKIEELNKSPKLSYTSNVLFPFANIPEMSIKYFRMYREIELQVKIMKFVLPLYEQALVEEQKSIPTLVVVDKAVPPQLKYSPKKAFIILLFFFLGIFIMVPLIFLGEKTINQRSQNNPIEKFQYRFFTKIKKIYRIKI